MLANKLMGGAGAEEKLYVDDVFSTYLYTGNGSTQTITNGIDLAGEGGLVWTKSRSQAYNHQLIDTVRGGGNSLLSNTTNAQIAYGFISAFNNNGYVLSDGGDVNGTTQTFASWTFRKAPKFFDVQTATLGTGNATVSFSGLSTIGMVIVKRTDSTGDWYVWHRSLTAGKLMYLNQTAAEATLGHITVSGTTLTLVDGTLADGNYVCYAFTHDTATDGIIQCGSFSGNATTTLGWEPQYIMYKRTDSTSNWVTVDSMRGIPTGASDRELYPNLVNAEAASASDYVTLNATGFTTTNLTGTFVYLAIRRPNKPPTSGTQVYNAIARTGTGAAATVTGVGFAPDLVINHRKDAGISGNGSEWWDRLRGRPCLLKSAVTDAETAYSDNTQDLVSFDMNGLSLGIGAYSQINYLNRLNIIWFFRRAPGFFDVVCDTGTGSAHTINHNLGAVPELMIRKKRSAADNWIVYAGDATDYLILNDTAATADLDTMWNDTAPTASVFTVGTNDDVNQSTGTFATYLFATLPGISKVGSYTGNGTSQTINCGFSAGARFVLIKRTDNTGDWYVWDSVRGIVAANDPHLSLNTTAAEVTTDDSIDPDNSGFIVNQNTATNINVTSATYIFLAVS